MTLAESRKLPFGVYIVHWKQGGSSYAAIGIESDGDRWLAPCNWIWPAVEDKQVWRKVKNVEPLRIGLTDESRRILKEEADRASSQD